MGKTGWGFCKEVNTVHTFDWYGVVVFVLLLYRKIDFLMNFGTHFLSYGSIIIVYYLYYLIFREKKLLLDLEFTNLNIFEHNHKYPKVATFVPLDLKSVF